LISNKIGFDDPNGQLVVKLDGPAVPASSINDWDQLPTVDGGFYPAAYDRVITVGATNSGSLSLATFSNFGRVVDILAPGTSIQSTFATPEAASKSAAGTFTPADLADSNAYFALQGTSMAAPIISGVVALMMYANHELRTTQDDTVKKILQASASNSIVTPQPDGGTAGRVDAFSAIRLAQRQFRFGQAATDPLFCDEANSVDDVEQYKKKLYDVPGFGSICTTMCSAASPCLFVNAVCTGEETSAERYCVPAANVPEPDISASVGWCTMSKAGSHAERLWGLLLAVCVGWLYRRRMQAIELA